MSAMYNMMCSLEHKQDELCNKYCKNQRQPDACPVWLGAMQLVWQEYEHGIGGRKAAHHFAWEERGHKK
eukprot:5915010-Ditylum_brightwellii.AAC.1